MIRLTICLLATVALLGAPALFAAEAASLKHSSSNTLSTTSTSADYLAALGPTQRLNSIIDIEVGRASDDHDRASAAEATMQWKIGRYDDALTTVSALERNGTTVQVGITWMVPIESGAAPQAGNVRLGTLSSAEAVSLSWHKQTGSLFALVDWGSANGWAVFMSSDRGISWVETYTWCCSADLSDASVVDDFLYVAYTVGSETRLRRASTTGGNIDSGYGWHTIADSTPAAVDEISLTTNADDADDRIHYSFLQDDGIVRHFWDQAADGTSFVEDSPAVSNASSGLSTTRNIGWPAQTGNDYFLLSFVGSDDSIYIYGLETAGWDSGTTVISGVSAAVTTSIASFHDTFLVAYENDMVNGQGISYRISYDGGGSWSGANLAAPPVGGDFYGPLVSARSGTGTGALYQQETGAVDTIHMQQRHNYSPGSWLSPSRVNDYDFNTGTTGFDCNWLGTGWGMTYIDTAGAVWFELSGALFYSGFERMGFSEWSSAEGAPCAAGSDADGDRLDDCYETNTGVYVSDTDTGTDPNNNDTDGDYIEDGDEVLGTLGGLDLPAMGLNPLRRDILVEYDWFDDSLECSTHTHRPTVGMVDRVSISFANSPESNPDGSTGINFVHDYGQGGVFSGGNLIDDNDGVLTGGVNSSEFGQHKNANFDSNRDGYFHYTILPHRYNTTSGSSGQAEFPGDDMIVSLYCANSERNVAHTIVHELGHNIGLGHGGFQNCNYKPNYNSVMNYRYQFPGVDSDCNVSGNGVLDYSYGDRLALNENNLNENLGVCGSPAIDWNGTGGIQTAVVFDINSSDGGQAGSCGGTLTTLQDSDDWGNMIFSGLANGDGAAPRMPFQIIDCDNPAPFN